MSANVQRLKLDQEQPLADAFPSVEPGITPFGSRLLVQIRSPKERTAGGIIITRDIQETEQWNTQVGKVVSLGPVAFKNRTTLEPWPEGSWCVPGEFVRVPKYGGDRWQVKHGKSESELALFVIFNDLDIIGRVTIDPRAIKAFI